MSIDLKIPKTSESVVVKYKLPKDVADEFELYVKAAQSESPEADESLVLATLLAYHMKRDRGFRAWLKTYSGSSNDSQQFDLKVSESDLDVKELT